MTRTKKLTIIIPTYNHERFIEEALDSVFLQKVNFDFDVLLCDDCSTDKTVRIAQEYAKKHSNLIVKQNSKNLGMLQNYKQAFAACKTEYIAILEGDDIWTDKNKLQKQVDLLDKDPEATMCFHHFKGLCQWDKSFVERPEKHTYNKDLITIESIYAIRTIGNFSVCIYRKKYIDQIPDDYYHTPNAADFLFNIHILKQGHGLCLRETCSLYRIHQNSQWSSLSEQEKREQTLHFVLDNCTALQGRYQNEFIKIINEAFEDFSTQEKAFQKHTTDIWILGLPLIKIKQVGYKTKFCFCGITLFKYKKK